MYYEVMFVKNTLKPGTPSWEHMAQALWILCILDQLLNLKHYQQITTSCHRHTCRFLNISNSSRTVETKDAQEYW